MDGQTKLAGKVVRAFQRKSPNFERPGFLLRSASVLRPHLHVPSHLRNRERHLFREGRNASPFGVELVGDDEDFGGGGVGRHHDLFVTEVILRGI